mmetsp:Transcript_14865/g.39801  ORF Transcript_14865/g.39801 Transcript_14865/m.39801 type:complete len:131 (+) Transcript_14865:367-759(+)
MQSQTALDFCDWSLKRWATSSHTHRSSAARSAAQSGALYRIQSRSYRAQTSPTFYRCLPEVRWQCFDGGVVMIPQRFNGKGSVNVLREEALDANSSTQIVRHGRSGVNTPKRKIQRKKLDMTNCANQIDW